MINYLRQPNSSENESGFIALISSIIIAAILMAMTFALGFSSFFGRLNIVDSEFKEKSIALAEGCADIAITRLQSDPDYTPASPPGDAVPIGSDACNIWSISPVSGWPKTIQIQAAYPPTLAKKSYTNLEVVVSLSSGRVTVDSWKEITNLP